MVALVGIHFYQQAIVLDTTAMELGVVMSDAMQGVAGLMMLTQQWPS